MAQHNTFARFPGNGNYELQLEVDVNSSQILAWLKVNKLAGSGYRTSNPQAWRIRIAGQEWSGTWTYNFAGIGHIVLAGPAVKNVGVGQHWVEAWVNMDSGFGQAYSAQMHTFTAIPNPPNLGAPYRITTTSARFDFSWTNDNGAPITQTQIQYSRNSGFTDIAWTDTPQASQGYSDPSGVGLALAPGTRYWVRARQYNNRGWSGWTGAREFTTLPSTPPSVSGAPTISGQGTQIKLSPPGGVSGVTEYNVERRVKGTTSPVTTATSTTTTLNVTGLVPGTSYEFRANAEIGTYTSPWSDWITVVQPNPNTSPGDFFDGNTAARDRVTFAWTGSAGASTSEARGVGVEGWAITNTLGTGARLAQAASTVRGVDAARALFFADATGAGVVLGQSAAADMRSSVEPGVMYGGSIYAMPSRSQRLAARITFLNAAGGVVISYTGTPELVGPTAPERLEVAAQAPPNAEFATVGVVDVGGTGWTAWRGGEHLDADAAMITLDSLYPYFDGDTPDEPGYEYSWAGTAHKSPSIRKTIPVVVPDPLQDPDCDPIPLPPMPPTIETDCIEEIGEWRRYTVTIPSSEVRRWSAAIPTVILTTGGAAERQVRIRYYANPEDVAAELIDKSDWEAEQILTYVPPATELTVDGVSQRAYAAVGLADPVPANHLLYGTGGGPPTWPELQCGVGYVVTFDTPLEAPTGNLKTRMVLTQRM